MGYRDDLEAARARADALEQQLADKDESIAELNAELEGKKQAEKAARRARRRAGWRQWWPWLMLSVMLMGGIAGGVLYCVRALSQKLEGSFVAKGTSAGDWTLTPDECDSGQRRGFIGVDLSAGDTLVRMVESPTQGPTVVINRGGKRVATLNPETCKTFLRSIKRTNTTVNDVRLLDGFVELDCRLPKGGTIRGKVTFENCR